MQLTEELNIAELFAEGSAIVEAIVVEGAKSVFGEDGNQLARTTDRVKAIIPKGYFMGFQQCFGSVKFAKQHNICFQRFREEKDLLG